MLSGTITVFHESKNATLALRGCTHFENIRRRESHFSQKNILKKCHFHHDKRCILGNECSVAPLGCSTSPKTPLLPYEVAPTSRTFADGNHTFPHKSPSKTDISTMINDMFWKMNAQWHHYGVPRVQKRHPFIT